MPLFSLILLEILVTYGYEDLLLAGLLAEIILCHMGIFKLYKFNLGLQLNTQSINYFFRCTI